MRKKTIGEVLKLARTNQGMSLEELSEKTDIQLDLLQAIERNDYDLLPSPFYARSFLRKYAWAVDLDEAIILEAYEAGEMLVYDEVELAADQDYRSRKNKRKRSFLPLFYFLLVSLAIVAFVSYYVWTFAQNRRSGGDFAESYSLVSSESSSSSTSQASSVPASSSSAPAGKLEVSGSGDHLDVSYSGASQPVPVNFSVNEEAAWLSVSNSELAEGVTLSPDANTSQTVMLEPGSSTEINLGSVKAVKITVNNQPLDLSALTSDSASLSLAIHS